MKQTSENAANWLDAGKQLAIILAIVLFFVWPQLISRSLDVIGLQEGEFGALKIKRRLLATDDALARANATNSDLVRLIGLAQEVVQGQKSVIDRFPSYSRQEAEQISEKSNKISDLLTAALQSAQATSNISQATLTVNAPIITEVQERAGASPRWVVIAAADFTENEARSDLRRLRDKGFPDAQLIQRGGAFHLAIIRSSREAANQTLSALPSEFKRVKPYIINLDSWCGNQNTSRTDLMVCDDRG